MGEVTANHMDVICNVTRHQAKPNVNKCDQLKFVTNVTPMKHQKHPWVLCASMAKFLSYQPTKFGEEPIYLSCFYYGGKWRQYCLL